MFRTPCFHHHEEYIVHAAVYVLFSMRVKQEVCQVEGYAQYYACKTHHVRLHVQYSLPVDGHKMFETCRRQEELN